jgi:hypothetical protein
MKSTPLWIQLRRLPQVYIVVEKPDEVQEDFALILHRVEFGWLYLISRIEAAGEFQVRKVLSWLVLCCSVDAS